MKGIARLRPLLTHPDTYESLVYETNFVDEVCRSLSKRNNEVQVVCEQILKIVMELDRVEAKPPKKKKQRGRDDEMEAAHLKLGLASSSLSPLVSSYC